MKTPVEELFEKLWDVPKDKFNWHVIRIQMLKKEKEVIDDIIDIIDSENSGQSAEQRLDEIKTYLLTFNVKEKCQTKKF
jgi:hypothetical protein